MGLLDNKLEGLIDATKSIIETEREKREREREAEKEVEGKEVPKTSIVPQE